jgi:hypothetical protein
VLSLHARGAGDQVLSTRPRGASTWASWATCCARCAVRQRCWMLQLLLCSDNMRAPVCRTRHNSCPYIPTAVPRQVAQAAGQQAPMWWAAAVQARHPHIRRGAATCMHNKGCTMHALSVAVVLQVVGCSPL